jgi:deazaflavin-dependent oxidoreductase (nitroreductase family)
MNVRAHHAAHRRRPLFGVRRAPGRLALTLMRLPRPLYRHGWGQALGHVFLMVTHVGRNSGLQRETVAMPLTYDPVSHEVVICSAWGPRSEWIRNLKARPAIRVQVGRESYVPEQRFLSEDESVEVALAFKRRHPARVRLASWILGWRLASEEEVREFVRTRPFVAFRPLRQARSRAASITCSASARLP